MSWALACGSRSTLASHYVWSRLRSRRAGQETLFVQMRMRGGAPGHACPGAARSIPGAARPTPSPARSPRCSCSRTGLEGAAHRPAGLGDPRKWPGPPADSTVVPPTADLYFAARAGGAGPGDSIHSLSRTRGSRRPGACFLTRPGLSLLEGSGGDPSRRPALHLLCVPHRDTRCGAAAPA